MCIVPRCLLDLAVRSECFRGIEVRVEQAFAGDFLGPAVTEIAGKAEILDTVSWGGQQLSSVYHIAVDDTFGQPAGVQAGGLGKNAVKKGLVSPLQITSVLRSETTHERA